VFDSGVEELYDLSNDPDESNNLINNPDLVGVRDELFAYGQMIRSG